jgi:hypothetical protein
MADYEVEGGWRLLLRFRSFDGIVELVEAGLVYLGDCAPGDGAQWLEQRNSVPVPATRGTPFRYRWLRGVGQQYERDARRRLLQRFRGLAHVTLADELADEGWYQREPARRGHGDRFYAEIAHEVVAIQGEGGNVLLELAQRHYVAYPTAKEWVTQAGDRGFLTKPGKGRRGARQLTPRARRLLDGEHPEAP